MPATYLRSRKPPPKRPSAPPKEAALAAKQLAYDGPPSWTRPGRRAALSKWVAVIAKEVGRACETKTTRDAAEAFARAHRLSIAHAFERWLVRKDVVAEPLRMFEMERSNKPDVGACTQDDPL